MLAMHGFALRLRYDGRTTLPLDEPLLLFPQIAHSTRALGIPSHMLVEPFMVHVIMTPL